MFRAAVGHGYDVDAHDAVGAAVRSCKRQLDGEAPKAGLLFCSAEIDHAVVLSEVARAFPSVPVIGGSSGGEMSASLGFTDESVLLLLLSGDGLEVGVGVGLDADRDVHGAAAVAVATARASMRTSPKVCISVCEGETVSPSVAVAALQAALPGVPVVGGAASSALDKTGLVREFAGQNVVGSAITVLLLGGALRIGHGMACGWQPIGKTHTITKAEGNLLLELDGTPATEVYESYIGKVSQAADFLFKHHPLAIYEPGNRAFYLRALHGRGATVGSLKCAGDVPRGAQVRLTEADRSEVLAGASESLARATAMYGATKPELALLFSCALRRAVLGTWTHREAGLARTYLGEGVPLVGLYTFGEFAPVEPGRPARAFNGTLVSLVLGGER